MKVEEVLKPGRGPSAFGVIAVSTEATVGEALAVMRKQEIHHLIVGGEGKLEGVISDRDMIAAAFDSEAKLMDTSLSIAPMITRDFVKVDVSTDLGELLQQMHAKKVSAAVVFEDEELQGLITESDLLVHLREMAASEETAEIVKVSQVFLSDPLMQSAMKTLSDLGI